MFPVSEWSLYAEEIWHGIWDLPSGIRKSLRISDQLLVVPSVGQTKKHRGSKGLLFNAGSCDGYRPGGSPAATEQLWALARASTKPVRNSITAPPSASNGNRCLSHPCFPREGGMEVWRQGFSMTQRGRFLYWRESIRSNLWIGTYLCFHMFSDGLQ